MKFTIGTVSSNLEFEEDLKLIKSSLLYADDIELIGMAEYAVFKYLPNCISLASDVFELMDNFMPMLKMVEGNGAPELLEQIDAINLKAEPYMNSLRKKKRRNRDEIIAQKKLEIVLKQAKSDLTESIKGLTNSPGVNAIDALIKKEIVSVHDYNDMKPTADSMAGGYFGNLIGVMKSGASFPLFDKTSTDIISNVTKNKIIDFSKYNPEVLRHAGVSSRILMTLPGLEHAEIDEIIDFKRENEKSLISFRASMYKFSEIVKSLPWDDDFQFECTKLYEKEVLPQIVAINELATDTSVAKNMGKQFVRDAEARKKLMFMTGGLATSITTASNFASALGSIRDLILTASLVVIAPATVSAFMKAMNYHSIAKEKVEKVNKEIRGNTMFYYYKASEKFK